MNHILYRTLDKILVLFIQSSILFLFVAFMSGCGARFMW